MNRWARPPLGRLAAAAALLCLIACGNPQPSLKVSVDDTGKRCEVERRSIPCDSVGPYLRDTARIPPDRPISVLLDGHEEVRARGQRIDRLLKSAGYSNVTAVGFLSEPDGRSTPARLDSAFDSVRGSHTPE